MEKKNAPSLHRIKELLKIMNDNALDLMEIDGDKMRFVKSRHTAQPAKAPEKPRDIPPKPEKVSPEAMAQGLYAMTHLMDGSN